MSAVRNEGFLHEENVRVVRNAELELILLRKQRIVSRRQTGDGKPILKRSNSMVRRKSVAIDRVVEPRQLPNIDSTRVIRSPTTSCANGHSVPRRLDFGNNGNGLTNENDSDEDDSNLMVADDENVTPQSNPVAISSVSAPASKLRKVYFIPKSPELAVRRSPTQRFYGRDVRKVPDLIPIGKASSARPDGNGQKRTIIPKGTAVQIILKHVN